jgi:ElaB/YqjD/DUF883 family membrane-anchored ribosome-binding protein
MTKTTGASAQPGPTDQASEKVQDAALAAQEKASELREQGTARLRDQFDQRSNQAGSQVRSLADALRRSSSDLSSEGNSSGARLAEQAADRIERVGSYLEQKRGDELLRDIETFARRRPWMLAGVGMLAGIAGARFMKASSEQRYGNDGRYAPSHGTGSSGDGLQRRHTGGNGTDLAPRSNAPAGLSDEPLTRDPYAARR